MTNNIKLANLNCRSQILTVEEKSSRSGEVEVIPVSSYCCGSDLSVDLHETEDCCYHQRGEGQHLQRI